MTEERKGPIARGMGNEKTRLGQGLQETAIGVAVWIHGVRIMGMAWQAIRELAAKR